MHGTRMLVLALAALVALSACRKPRKVVHSKEQEAQIQASILSERPTPQVPANADLDGKVRFLGLDLSDKQVKAGEAVDVTWYWEALADLEGDWKIFVHLEVPGKRRTVHDHQAVGELLPVGRWKKGQIIKDVQKIRVADDFPGGTARLYVGIFDEQAWVQRQQNVRMTVQNAADAGVPVDGEGRIQAATLQVVGKDGKAAGTSEPRKPAYTAVRAEEPPTLDGKLDDAVWRLARPTPAFVQPGGGALPPNRLTQARLAWDATYLYVAASCRDDDITNDKKGRDATLWEQDVVEIYLDPGSDGRDYVEIQVAPTGEIFDAVFASHRTPPWQEAAKKLDLAGMRVHVDAKGSVNARDDGVQDASWTVEVAIPWAELPGVSGPPAEGTTWAVNLYRIDAAAPGRPGFMAAWSPAGGDFHNTSGFGTVTFAAASPRGEPGAAVRPLGRTPASAEPLRRAVAPPATGEAQAAPPGAPNAAAPEAPVQRPGGAPPATP